MKKALLILGVLALVAGGALYWAWNSLDLVVKTAIEHFGPSLTGTTVTVREVNLAALDGRGRLKGLEIGSPPGFGARRTAWFGEIRVVLDSRTVSGPVVVIPEIAIEAPEITYEKGARGSNLEAIQANIARQVAGSPVRPADGGGSSGGSGRRYAIGKLTIRSARVTMTNPGLKGQGITFTLPDIELRDIGRLPEGVTAAQAADVVTQAIVSKIAQRVLTNIELLRRGGAEGLKDALRGLLK